MHGGVRGVFGCGNGHTGKKQVIELPAAIDPNNPGYADKIITRADLNLKDSLKKGYTTVYDQ
jgi:hypothetical protein